MSGNGSSYQKDGNGGGNGGGYEHIPNGNGSARGSNKKWIVGAVLFAVLGAIGLKVTHKPPGASTDAAMAKADLPKSKNGKLKLFDSDREYLTNRTAL
jgi:hypothetical protein